MDDLANRLIVRAPTILVVVAIAFLVGGILNAFISYANLVANPDVSGNALSFLWGFLYNMLYQPALLLAWAAVVKYLSIIAGRATL